jgi:hypothetical protein
MVNGVAPALSAIVNSGDGKITDPKTVVAETTSS